MKKTTLIITALAAFALAGCNIGGEISYSGSRYLPVERTEKITAADGTVTTYVTEVSYDTAGEVSKEVTKKNGNPYREMSGYKGGTNTEGFLTLECTRITTNDDGTTITHKLISTFGVLLNNTYLETDFEVFAPGNLVPVEYRSVEYRQNGEINIYDALTAEGERVTRTEFVYSSSPWTETYRENGAARMGVLKSNPDANRRHLEYKLYRNVPELWDGQEHPGMRLLEEKIEYKTEGNKETWKVKKYTYDSEGNQSVLSTTEVEIKNDNINFAY